METRSKSDSFNFAVFTARHHHVAIPTLHFHRAIHVLQLKLAARLQRIRLIELLLMAKLGTAATASAYQHRRRKDQLAKFR